MASQTERASSADGGANSAPVAQMPVGGPGDGPPPRPPRPSLGAVMITSPSDGDTVVAGAVTISGTAGGSWFPIDEVVVTVGGGTPATVGVDGSFDGQVFEGTWSFPTTLPDTPGPLTIYARDGRRATADEITIYVSRSEVRTKLPPAGASSGNIAAMVAVDENGRVWYTWWELGGGGKGWLPLQDDYHTDAAPAAALIGTYLYVLIKRTGEDTLYLNQGNLGKPFVGWL